MPQYINIMKALMAVEINGVISYLEVAVDHINVQHGTSFQSFPHPRLTIEGFIVREYKSQQEWREAKVEPTKRLESNG